MQEKKWNPGHSTHKGYPYAGVASKQIDQQLPILSKDKDDKLRIEHFFKDPPETLSEFEGYLVSRLYDFQEALRIAEGQVEDLLTEDPFMPEKFGFELAVNTAKGQDIHTPPVQIYVNKYDSSFSLFRKPADSTAESFNPTLYVLLKKVDDGKFNETELSLPCARIAYAALWALGVQMDEPEKVEEVKEKKFVDFKREEPKAEFTITVDDGPEEEMIAAAKKMIESHPIAPYRNVLTEELTIGMTKK